MFFFLAKLIDAHAITIGAALPPINKVGKLLRMFHCTMCGVRANSGLMHGVRALNELSK